MGFLTKVLRERKRGRRDFGPPMGGRRMFPAIPSPIPSSGRGGLKGVFDNIQEFIAQNPDKTRQGGGILGGVDLTGESLRKAYDEGKGVLQRPLFGEMNPGNVLPPVVGGPALPPIDPRIIPQRPIIPPKRNDFMSIERINEPKNEFIPSMPNETPSPFIPPPPLQPVLQQPQPIGVPSLMDPRQPQPNLATGVIDPVSQPIQQLPLGPQIIPQVPNPFEKPIMPPKRDDFMSIERIGGPGGGFNDDRVFAGGSPAFNERGSVFTPPSVGDGMFDNNPVQGIIQPPVTDPTVSTEPVTTPTDPNMSVNMPVAPIDPVLLQQSASEVQTDPLLRSLYFGTADSPGFYNQLQQAGANLIGSDVPLQQTAGLTPLELLARQQAVAGLGGFEPFLQQNRNLVNQAIEQSRRAEGLQDPYYTQAEEIYKDTMGAYDPSMTQQFFNPFEDAVVQQTISDVLEAGEQQDIAARAREISSGAFGGSRARLGAEERRQDLGEGLAKALSGIRQTGFRQAQSTGLSEFARQQAAKRTGAQGLMGIGVGRGSAASDLGRQLAGYGSQMAGLGRTQEELRRGQRGELSGYGTTGRGIAETGLGRIYEQQMGQQMRPLGVLGQIGSMLPGYQAASSRIDSQYGMPTDPAAAGLGAAFSAYGAVAPRQGGS